jgi:hypothetical protein
VIHFRIEQGCCDWLVFLERAALHGAAANSALCSQTIDYSSFYTLSFMLMKYQVLDNSSIGAFRSQNGLVRSIAAGFTVRDVAGVFTKKFMLPGAAARARTTRINNPVALLGYARQPLSKPSFASKHRLP